MSRPLLFLTFFLLLGACAQMAVVAAKKAPAEQAARLPSFNPTKAAPAMLSFAHHIEMLSETKPSRQQVIDYVNRQVMHIFGPMAYENARAMPTENHTIKVTSFSLKPGERGIYEIGYDYSGKVLIEKGLGRYYEVYLPLNPGTIWTDSHEAGATSCVDPRYQEEGDYWFFWAPNHYRGCTVQSGTHFVKVQGTVEWLKPEKPTFPEFDRLAAGGTIDVHILFGKDEAPNAPRDPEHSDEENAKNYRALREELSQLGFNFQRWPATRIRQVLPAMAGEPDPVVEEAVKGYPAKGLNIRVRLWYGPSSLERGRGFHYFFRDALVNSSIIIFDGYNGSGSTLNLEQIAKKRGPEFNFAFEPDRYQILFLNSVSSYAYYNALHFNRRRPRPLPLEPKSTKNLDILSTGRTKGLNIESDMRFLKALVLYTEKGKWSSYQTMAKRAAGGSFFFVNGDEDNPKEAPPAK